MDSLHILKALKNDFDFDLERRSFDDFRFNYESNIYELNPNGEIVGLALRGSSSKDELNVESIIELLHGVPTLKKFGLNGFGITDTSVLEKLRYLTSLNLNENNISDLSPLKKIKLLSILYVSDNKIRDVASINELNELKEIIAIDNRIEDINSLIYLKKLEKINFSGNRIANLKIFDSTNNISFAWLYSNKIENIPDALVSKKLKYLGLGQNEISDLSFIKKFINLKELQLIDNSISDITPLKGLVNLNSIRLNNNSIVDISPLENLCKVTELNLESNNIEDISILKNCTSLTHLYLKNNKINTINSLKDLKELKRIDISNNNINELPKWIVDAELEVNWISKAGAFSGFNLFGNPIENVPYEIIKKGKGAVTRYFEKISQEGRDFIYEAKLIFVGEGSAGKTSLQKRIISGKALLPKKDKRTRGIVINDWTFKREKARKHVAHIWDFGGQDVYYPVHRFFITENSVFVLLASSRQTHHNFDYWIPTIYQFGGNSPIIIGQTCHDGNRIPWNDLGVYISNVNFNIIKTQELPYYEINLPEQNTGLEKIKAVIEHQIENLPHYGRGVPSSWVQIRNTLNDISKNTPCITIEVFEGICKKTSIENFSDFNDISDCCQFLHDIGVALWYSKSEELKNWVILQPEWAMNAVYEIIDDIEIQQRRGNIISNDFTRLWKADTYIGKHNILKKMLEIFKIAFPKKHRQEDYIIPARLLSMPNENKWQRDEPLLHIEYKYEFMPRGLVNQVSAELSRYITKENEVWNNAVNFYFDNDRAKCQVTEDFYNRKITIKANGKDARSIITLVMNSLENINEAYKGVRPEINVPCICSQCSTVEIPNMFLYSKLLNWSVKKEAVVCNESGDKILISDLLFNVGLKYYESTNNKVMKKTITLFLASSSELQDDRIQFELFIGRENKRLDKDEIFIKIEMWEDFIDTMSVTRLQDEYNKVIEHCDIFVSLFFSKVGKFTEEEFQTAFGNFKSKGKPLIYIYFKNEQINMSDIKEKDMVSKFKFEKKLKALGHFPTQYNNIEDLKFKFKSQLDKILPSL